jgi:hypothetical protein
MKRYIYLKFFILCSLFALLLLGVSSCGSMRKTKTVTVTQILKQVDTVIVVRHDTTIKVKEVTIHDTAKIETPLLRAWSYYSPEKQKIVLKVQEQNEKVPIKIKETTSQTVTENTKTVTPVKHHWYIWILIFAVIAFWGYIIIPYLFKKKTL